MEDLISLKYLVFEIFGYDFMLDADFNVFLIEINSNPGLEISSPWIQIIIPRMLDDALRLTVDKVFEPIYDFSKNHQAKLKEEDKLIFEKNKNKIEIDFNAVNINIENNKENEKDKDNDDKNNLNNQLNISKDSSNNTSAGNTNNNNNNIDNKNAIKNNNIETPKTTIGINKNISNNIFNINLESDDTKTLDKNPENDDGINIYNKDVIKKEINIIENKEKINKENKQNFKNKKKLSEKDKIKEKTIEQLKYNGKYISPFPVPGYSNDENLWCFVCDLNSKDPLDIKLEKEKENEKQNEKISFTGIRHLLKKKDKKNNEKKNGKKGGKKNKAKKEKEKNKKH